MARAVALWLAACALAARAQVEHVRPRCNYPSCRWLRTEINAPIGYSDVYSVYGQELRINSSDGKIYEAQCSVAVLDDPAWPRFPNPVRFEEVSLYGCAPPASMSYAASLQALNVVLDEALNFWKLPLESHLSAASLNDLPYSLDELWLSADSGVLVLDPDTLNSLYGLRALHLWRVRPDLLPPKLEILTLWDTGIEALPHSALGVVSLKIRERNLKSISGSAPRMKSLFLERAPALVTLVLHDAPRELLRDGLLRKCRALQVLELRRMHSDHLPERVLREVVDLTNFTYTHGFIKALPESLFENTSRLQHIDLSYNKLESLSSTVFSSLGELFVLRLENNRLGARDLRAVAALYTLTTLALGGNSLGDLCPDGDTSVLSQLPQLQELSLARTGASQICPDWLSGLPYLQYLDLRSNAIHSVSCDNFRVEHTIGSDVTVVDFKGNLLERFYCTKDDWNEYGSDNSFKEINLVLESISMCNCNCSYVRCVTTTPTPATDYGYRRPDEIEHLTPAPDNLYDSSMFGDSWNLVPKTTRSGRRRPILEYNGTQQDTHHRKRSPWFR